MRENVPNNGGINSFRKTINDIFAVFKNQSIFYFIVQLFGIKRLNWLISSSLKKITFPQVLSRSLKRYPL